MRESKSGTSANTWFLTGTYTSVLNVPSTPGGLLAKKVRNAIGNFKAPDGGTTKVVESGGNRLTAETTEIIDSEYRNCKHKFTFILFLV